MNFTVQRFFWPITATFLLLVFAWSVWSNQLFLPLSVLGIIGTVLLMLHPKKLFWLLLIAVPLSFEYQIDKHLGTDFPDEMLMLLSVATALLFLTMYRSEQLRSVIKHPLFYLILLQFIWAITSTIHSQAPVLSIKFILAKIWYIVPFTIVPLFVLTDKKQWITLGWSILLPVVAIALYTNWRHSDYGFSFQMINEAASLIFRNHVTYAASISFGFCVAAGVWILQPAYRKNIWLNSILVVLLFTLYFSYTRGTWVSVTLSLLLVPFFLKRRIIPIIILCISSIVLFTGYMIQDDHYFALQPDFEKTIIHDNLADHLDATYSMKELSTSERFYRWIAAFRMCTEHPAVGFGPSTFYSQYKPFADQRFRTYVSENPEKSTVHNYYLLTLVEQGFVGLVLLLLLLVSFYVYCQKLFFQIQDGFYKTVLLITFLVMTNIVIINFFSDMIETDKVGTFYFLCFGVLMLIDYKHKQNKDLMPVH